jgi:(E)-4-hydroxy-3-methylbut-2-enyl-diphosphate synthase
MGRWARECGLEDPFFSFKTSDCRQTIWLNGEAKKRMEKEGWSPPFHLGVTEAANGWEGRIKGALGVGILLSQGLGPTLRISLTEPPVQEVLFAQKLLQFLNHLPFSSANLTPAPRRVTLETGPRRPPAPSVAILPPFPAPWDRDEKIFHTIHGILATPYLATVYLENGPDLGLRRTLVETVLQACGWGKFATEIVACPTCGRTSCNVAALVDEVRRRLGHLPHLKIAVMGCVVNGLGEIGDADYGCIGCGRGRVNLYRKDVCVERGVDEKTAISALENMLARDGKWVQSGYRPCAFPSEIT